MTFNPQMIADREKLESILERDPFRQEERFHFWEWAGEKIGQLLSKFPDIHVPDEAGNTIVGLVIVGLIAIVLVGIWASVRWWLRMRRKPDLAPLQFQDDKIRDDDDYLKEAEDLRRQGRWAEAIRFVFIAGLLRLDQRGWIEAETWKTNREYLDELHYNKPAAAPGFRRAAQLFERIWYGGELADEAGYRHMIDWVSSKERGDTDAPQT